MTDQMIERVVEAGKAAVWDLILSGDAKGAKAVTKTTRACLAAALRAWTDTVQFGSDTHSQYAFSVVCDLASKLEKSDG